MIAILPIYFLPGEDYWKSPLGLELMEPFLAGIAKLGREMEIMAHTDDAETARLAAKCGLTMYLEGTGGGPRSFLPPGAEAMLELASRKAVKDAAVAIIDFRNPLLSLDIIRVAARVLRESGRDILVSCEDTRDTPCQFNRYHVVREIGTISLGGTEAADDCPETVAAAARAGLPPGASLAGSRIAGGIRRFPFLWKTGRDGWHVVFDGAPDAQAEFELKLVPAGPEGPQPDKAIGIPLMGSPAATRIPMDLDGFDRIHYLLFGMAENEICDLSEAYANAELGWICDYASGFRINLTTGSIITGRQDFPSICRRDGSLVVTTPAWFEAWKKAGVIENPCPFGIEYSASQMVRSRLDLLRAKVKRELSAGK